MLSGGLKIGYHTSKSPSKNEETDDQGSFPIILAILPPFFDGHQIWKKLFPSFSEPVNRQVQLLQYLQLVRRVASAASVLKRWQQIQESALGLLTIWWKLHRHLNQPTFFGTLTPTLTMSLALLSDQLATLAWHRQLHLAGAHIVTAIPPKPLSSLKTFPCEGIPLKSCTSLQLHLQVH